MDDTLKMWKIQTHSQGNSRNYNFDLSCSKFCQSFSLLFVCQTRVVYSDI